MARPGEDPLRPGPRSLFPLDTETNVPGEVVDLLRMLGQASNDAALAVVDAQGQFAHAAEAFWRCQPQIDRGDPVGRVAEERFHACRDHVERLTALVSLRPRSRPVRAERVAVTSRPRSAARLGCLYSNLPPLRSTSGKVTFCPRAHR
jgi:hypothetical protein